MRSERRSERVTAFGHVWKLRDAPASEWVEAVLSEDMSGVFPGMVRSQDAGMAFDILITLPDVRRRCINVARVALSRVSGREWFWAHNLIREAAGSWPYLNGMLVRQGVRADTEHLADWLDAAYTQFREVYDDKQRKALDVRLKQVPKGAAAAGMPKPVMSSRADLAAFAAD